MSNVTTLTVIDEATCRDIAVGAAILGTGGGGDPYVGMLMAEQAIREHGPVEVISLDSLTDSDVVYPVAMMGAPTVMVEKTPSIHQFKNVVEASASYLDRPATHLACIEAGGVNSMIPIAAAAQMSLPLVDGDGMGRAFPELQMVLPTINGIAATPLSLADEKGNTAVIDTVTNKWAERIARSATIEMGCSAIVSNYPMTGKQTADSFVSGTLSLCAELGREVTRLRHAAGSAVEAIVSTLNGVKVASGKVIDVERRTTAGFAHGRARIDCLEGELVLGFQNEHLVAKLSDEYVVTTPDLIMVVDTDTGEPITTEQLRFGNRVTVLAAPADERWHTSEGLEIAGPRYFGYDTDPIRPNWNR